VRFHILGLAHTATSKDYLACAFTQKVFKMCQMLKARGHYVIHYGNELSDMPCDENVVVTNAEDIKPPAQFLEYDIQSPVYAKFNGGAIYEIAKRKQPNDFLLCTFGAGHRVVCDSHPDMIVVESGIGYPGGYFAPFKVWESYSIMHTAYGLEAVRLADHFKWYSVVIPNSFDREDFIFSEKKGNYLLFLGMRHNGTGKGYNVAVDAAKEAGMPLIVAGPSAPKDPPPHVKYAGLVDVKQRAHLLAHARALLAPSLFMEPMCGAMIEAFFSGTPVISTDWGAFAEYNVNGATGWRARTHSEFVDGIRRAEEIDPQTCRNWAERFSNESISVQYDSFFRSVMLTRTAKGWYEPGASQLGLRIERYPEPRPAEKPVKPVAKRSRAKVQAVA
jgi:glycosyltransferase involved in cell wall biosynthesis